VFHHSQHQVIPPLPRLVGPPAPSYMWINEIRYWGLRACTPSCCYCTHQCGCSTVHSTALRASMCCNGVHVAHAVSMEATVILSCVCHMRVAVDDVWLEHSVIGSHLDRPHFTVFGSALCTVLQYGRTPLMFAALYGHADALQALLDAGADRYAKVRMTPCSLMTAHEIILSMGYCCSLLTVYGVLHASCDDNVHADVPCLVCAHGVQPDGGISCVCTG